MAQSWENIEIIISDNASNHPDSTETEKRIRKLDKDNKVRYFRQSKNIGAANNFKFVLDQSGGSYFMWNADDDIRSNNFIETQIRFLEEKHSYSASTSPNGFVKSFDRVPEEWTTFDLSGDYFSRLNVFLDHAMASHGIFYSLIRKKILDRCPFIGSDFLATDWAIIIYLLSQGPIARQKEGHILISDSGVSSEAGHYLKYSNSCTDYFLPFNKLYSAVKPLLKNLHFKQKIHIKVRIMKFNMAYYRYLRSELKMKIWLMLKKNKLYI